MKQANYIDPLTHGNNRNAFKKFLNSNNTNLQNNTIVLLDIALFAHYNNDLGHNKGDHLIYDIFKQLVKYYSYTNIYRYSGNQFILIFDDINHFKNIELKKLIVILENITVVDFNIKNVGKVDIRLIIKANYPELENLLEFYNY